MKRNWMRRLLGLLLIPALALGLCVPAFAADLEGARQAIVRGFANGDEEIDLSDYDIDEDQLDDLYDELWTGGELAWYVDSYQYYYDGLTGAVSSVRLNLLDESVYDRELYEQKMAQILAEAVLPGMSQWQIALSVHDYLVSHYEYDLSYVRHESYDLVVDGTAVCEGYTIAYMDLLRRAGLECAMVISEDMDHSWNLVKIDGSWYHVDATWDDPTQDCHGRVRHNYFLVDDAMIADADHNHYGWETDYIADNAGMNTGMFWQETDNQICYESSAVSYIRKDEGFEHWIYRRDEQTGELTELAYFDAGSVDVGGGTCHYTHYGLSLWNGRLYYSDMEHVWSMNTDGTDTQLEYEIDAEAEGYFIMGSFVDDGVIHLTFCDRDYNLTKKQHVLPGASQHTHDYTAIQVWDDCTQPGYVNHVCSCGLSYVGKSLEPTDHRFDSGVVTREPTADLDGLRTCTCTVCGATREEPIPALGHGTVVAPPAQEQEGGFPWPIVIAAVALALLGLLFLLRRRRPKAGPLNEGYEILRVDGPGK